MRHILAILLTFTAAIFALAAPSGNIARGILE